MKYILIAFLTIISINASKADSWNPPKVEVYYSADSTYYVRVLPMHVPEKYGDWRQAKANKKRKFSPQDTAITPCHAIMYKHTVKGDSLVWQENLINRIAPVAVLVANDGKYLVTFDNWGSLGYGVDVFVVYDQKGMLLKRHNLEDVSPFPINTYFRSISSIWWKCGAKFLDSKTIEIYFQDEDKKVESRKYNLVSLKIQ